MDSQLSGLKDGWMNIGQLVAWINGWMVDWLDD